MEYNMNIDEILENMEWMKAKGWAHTDDYRELQTMLDKLLETESTDYIDLNPEFSENN